MTTETDFTAADLLNVVNGGVDVFLQEDDTYRVPKVYWVTQKDRDYIHEAHPEMIESGETPYYFFAEKDERGFKKVARVEYEVFEDEDDAYDAISGSEFQTEAGYLPFGNFKMLDNGNLGDGHEAWALVEHESGRLFRFGGYYSSWDAGTVFDECVEVEPAEVRVIRYKPLGADDSESFDNPAVTV